METISLQESEIIEWDKIEGDDPWANIYSLKSQLMDKGFTNVRHRVTESDSFGPLCVLIEADKDGKKYDYLY